jgi:hypothetical protein
MELPFWIRPNGNVNNEMVSGDEKKKSFPWYGPMA